MAQAVYHYIENYSNVGKIGISYTAISDILKEAIKDIKHVIDVIILPFEDKISDIL